MIKIKLGMVDDDILYLKRLSELFSTRYKEQIEIYSFSDAAKVPDAVRENRLNVLLVSHNVNLDPDLIADFCVFAYFSESSDIDTLNDKKVVCKYQKAEVIYKQIISLYSEKLTDKVRYKNAANGKAAVSLFMSGCDGAGATTAAAAFAVLMTAKGRKTLFLNLKQFGNTENIFSAAGNGSFTDVIFAVKSKNANITLKLESAVKQSSNGVYFYDVCHSSLDYTEINAEELGILLNEICSSFGYKQVVIVSDFYFSDKLLLLLEKADNITIVADDSQTAKQHIARETEALSNLEKRSNFPICEKTSLILNRTKGTGLIKTEIPVIGVQTEIENSDDRTIVHMLAASGIFNKIAAAGV